MGMSGFRGEVLDWFDAGRVAPGGEQAVLRAAGMLPTPADWRAFLTERARELVDGGELVLTGGASFPDGRSGAEGLFMMIQHVIAEMVDDGELRAGEADRIFYPTWNRTMAEWTGPVEELGFEVLAHELTGTDDAENYGSALKLLDGRYAWLEEDILDPSGDGPMIAEQPDQAEERAAQAAGSGNGASAEGETEPVPAAQ